MEYLECSGGSGCESEGGGGGGTGRRLGGRGGGKEGEEGRGGEAKDVRRDEGAALEAVVEPGNGAERRALSDERRGGVVDSGSGVPVTVATRRNSPVWQDYLHSQFLTEFQGCLVLVAPFGYYEQMGHFPRQFPPELSPPSSNAQLNLVRVSGR